MGKTKSAKKGRAISAKAAKELLKAARLTLELLDDMTTDDFSLGADKPARDALSAAIKRARS